MSVPNQKKIYIERSSDNARKDYLKVSNQNLNLAMYNLGPSAFMLWIYFTDNANGYALDLYPSDFLSKTRLSDSTFRRSFKELVDKGYLLQHPTKKNTYMFREISDKAEYPDIICSFDKDDFELIKSEFYQNDYDRQQKE